MALDPPLESDAEEVRRALLPLRNDFSVALHSLQNPFAVGAIIRVAHSFLAREIIVIGVAPYYEKASMGMEKYERIVTVKDDSAFFEYAGARPVWAVEKDDAQQNVYDVADFPKEIIFVLGSERGGLEASFIARVSNVVAIPMYGVNHSFPVTVAAGIMMNEWARRRYRNAAL
ncbi:MAG: TrmH family RNA methyltransferase [Polyangiaceae bacterium]